MKKIVLFIFAAFLFGCYSGAGYNGEQQLPVIALQPYGKIDSSIVHAVRGGIQREFLCKVEILPSAALPSSAYHQPRNRYRAEKLIEVLRDDLGPEYFSVIGITARDISTTAHDVYDWGIMGLGYRPGKSCVISSFRSGKTAKDKKHLAARMATLALHEFGHNLSLPHCDSSFCIMQDAEGKNKLDQSKRYCESCKSKMQSANRLKKI